MLISRRKRRTVTSERRNKYLDLYKNAQKIACIESQNERMDIMSSVLEKYLVLSSIPDATDSQSTSSNPDENVVCTDEHYLRALVSKSNAKGMSRIISDFTVVPSRFSLVDFAAKLQPDEGQRYFDWEELEHFAEVTFRTTPHFSSCWTDLDAPEHIKEQPAKKQRMARKQVDQAPSRKIIPNNVQNDDQKKSEEYRHLNKSLRRNYESNGQKPVNFFKLVLDRESYPTTVENMFNFAFLIRENLAALKIGDDGMPVVKPTQSKDVKTSSSREEESRQMILSFDFDKWQKMSRNLGEQ